MCYQHDCVLQGGSDSGEAQFPIEAGQDIYASVSWQSTVAKPLQL